MTNFSKTKTFKIKFNIKDAFVRTLFNALETFFKNSQENLESRIKSNINLSINSNC